MTAGIGLLRKRGACYETQSVKCLRLESEGPDHYTKGQLHSTGSNSAVRINQNAKKVLSYAKSFYTLWQEIKS